MSQVACVHTYHCFYFYAGRDDKPASCVLFVSFADVFRQSTMVFTEQTGLENLYSMVAYAFNLKTLVTWLNILMLP